MKNLKKVKNLKNHHSFKPKTTKLMMQAMLAQLKMKRKRKQKLFQLVVRKLERGSQPSWWQVRLMQESWSRLTSMCTRCWSSFVWERLRRTPTGIAFWKTTSLFLCQSSMLMESTILKSTGSLTIKFFLRERIWILAAHVRSAPTTKTWELIWIDNLKLTSDKLMQLLITRMTTGEVQKGRVWLNPKTHVSWTMLVQRLFLSPRV